MSKRHKKHKHSCSSSEEEKECKRGYPGKPGDTGPQGNQGNQGNQGFQGPANGAQGNQGNQGNQGEQGNQGNQGEQGPQGFQGSGSQGSQGPQGSQGSQSDSCFIINGAGNFRATVCEENFPNALVVKTNALSDQYVAIEGLSIPDLGAGTRKVWNKTTQSFRVGKVSNLLWDAANTGYGSHAFGEDVGAVGPYSFATGLHALALQQGEWARASGAFSITGDAQTMMMHIRGANTSQSNTIDLATDGSLDYPQVSSSSAWTFQLNIIGKAGITPSVYHSQIIIGSCDRDGNGNLIIDSPTSLYTKTFGAPASSVSLLVNNPDEFLVRCFAGTVGGNQPPTKWYATLTISQVINNQI